ncbi:hypothetical protein MMC18_008891 [Xylographa bjoerkii]|nr:hypothetical protein [Xylographa bjoerkii]MCJ1395996.1 hypothetical protein [Xylographa bjoerkii]MCJ1396005.1 hypothetical protein [Xylographa bjoerkii]
MDAKPQRPMRTIRVHGDENVPPMVQGHKTLHSRNKSSPALSTIVSAGVTRVGIKRTAFGDVSNTATNRPARDDLAIGNKAGFEMTEKGIQPHQDKKPITLSRPAQRPLSVSSLKALLNNVGNTSSNGNTKQDISLLANTRKVLTKRNTAIFKDPVPQQIQNSIVDEQQVLPIQNQVAPVHRDLNYRHLHNEPEEPQLRRVKSNHVVASELLREAELVSSIALPETTGTTRSDGAFIDDFGNVHVCEYTDETDEPCEQPIERDGGVLLPEETRKAENAARLHQLVGAQLENTKHEMVRPQLLSTVSEPEEYWDEDEYEENYEEEGYVTARSFKSRGDNTTGGATTILFPKVTNKVKKELAAAKELVESSRTADEIEDEAWDMSMVAEYGDEIFQYMKELEIKMLPNAHYMDNQAEIQWSMRSVLMDWLVQVHHRFGLLPETLFLCVNYIDRFLSCKIVSLGKLQLVGATAIFVAAKYEEINCPSVQEIVYMVDGGYTVDEILKAERFMLSMLQFELGWPGPMSFLRRISKADDYDLETRTLAKYFLEITIMDERFLGSPPSFAAAGAHCLARMMLKKGSWSPSHVYYSNYTYSQLHSLVKLMFECCENPLKHHSAIYDKYLDKRYKKASQFVENELRRGFQVVDAINNNAATFVSFYNDQLLWDRK